ncbi:MAG TPA: hypothetical protein VJ739_10050 [Gemmataceae bacterium]|nr:hypothetical protein [Gemmataceae bacterium]
MIERDQRTADSDRRVITQEVNAEVPTDEPVERQAGRPARSVLGELDELVQEAHVVQPAAAGEGPQAPLPRPVAEGTSGGSTSPQPLPATRASCARPPPRLPIR